ncbi:hypothetical protein PVL29_011553 [Vitis rotundifolia]|uniref:Uncharacterized protein n=1 Tax=Vitis rotundifolia TaxID=103349 RepID=A0AA39DR10_VITRO|nr:hypothetical protein PVL29_011553 [Vitis rotundifolia]
MTKTRKVDIVGECASPRGLEHTKKSRSKTLSKQKEDESEWEETRCPICWEHPHNAVLLRCASHKKGCRPYMCNTSNHHSNCLNNFYQTFSKNVEIGDRPSGKKVTYVKCPMCRGKINGWQVVQPARGFMNSKPRSCPCEGCDFRGNYSQLRLHVRSEHPFARPAEPNPQLVREWARRVSERDFEDALNMIESESESELSYGDFVVL